MADDRVSCAQLKTRKDIEKRSWSLSDVAGIHVQMDDVTHFQITASGTEHLIFMAGGHLITCNQHMSSLTVPL